MALPPDSDQLANKIAAWPKWATETSILTLSAAIGRSNKELLAAITKTNELLKSQTSIANKSLKNEEKIIANNVAANSAQLRGLTSLSAGLSSLAKNQGQVIAAIKRLDATNKTKNKQSSGTEPKLSAATISLGTKGLYNAINTGFKSLLSQQDRANKNLIQVLGSINNDKPLQQSRTKNANSGSEENQDADSMLTSLANILSKFQTENNGGKTRAVDNLTINSSKLIDDLIKHTPDNMVIRLDKTQVNDLIGLIDNLKTQLKSSFGAAIDKPLAKFSTKFSAVLATAGSTAANLKLQARAAAGDDDAKKELAKQGALLRQALKGLQEEIKSAEVQTSRRANEGFGHYFRRVSGSPERKESNVDPIKNIIENPKAGFKSLAETLGHVAAGGLLVKYGFTRMTPILAAASAGIGLLGAVSSKLFTYWQEGAQSTTKAFGLGVGGLAGNVLSFTISAKTAGLTMEQFSKAITDAGGMAGMLDEDIKKSGQRFADGAKQYLDSAKKANFYGQNIEQLMQSYSRSVMMVGQAGLTGAPAQAAAMRMAEQQASDLYRLSQITGNSVDELNTAFNQLYRNDIFRAANQRMLANGE
ncbi:MAG: hypothetical protein EXR40_05955, partial [Nitrosomonadaceae bacterium]|nr:hypothetical protein [Nitrosomonadaceae bacterium]